MGGGRGGPSAVGYSGYVARGGSRLEIVDGHSPGHLLYLLAAIYSYVGGRNQYHVQDDSQGSGISGLMRIVTDVFLMLNPLNE
jgi:hypothetical protein